MRPVELELQAFGSYAGTEVVDFAPLAEHGLFVVCGPTGAGKSTLFDAMTFALFGTIPGERLEHVRSHHADRHTRTTAALTFDTAAGRFRVERTARHERPKQRGRGTTVEQPKAALYRVVGHTLEPIASRPQEVNARCEQLVGLTAAQFQRVVLLPQGKWAEFLMSDTASRRTLLQNLFGTQLYERATLLARDRVAAARETVDATRGEVERHRANATAAVAELLGALHDDDDVPAVAGDLAGLRRQLDELAPHIDDRRTAAVAAAAAAEAARDVHTAAIAVTTDWDRRAELRRRLATLQAEAATMHADAERGRCGERAAPVVAAHRAHVAADASHRGATEALERAQAVAVDAIVAAGIEAEPLAGASTRLADRRSVLGDQLAVVKAAAEAEAATHRLAAVEAGAADALEHGRRLVTDLEARRGPLETERNERFTVASGIDRCAAEVASTAEVLTLKAELGEFASHAEIARTAEADADATLDRLTSQFLADVAPELAARLTPGDPCPVCGSPEHPAPASAHPSTAVTRDDLARAKHRRDEATRALHDVLARIDDHLRRLGPQRGTDIDVLRQRHEASLAAHRLAADAEAAVVRLDLALARVDKELAEATERLPALTGRHATAVAEHAAKREAAAELRARAGEVTAVDIENRLDLVRRAERAVSRLEPLAQAAASARGAAAQTATLLADAVAASGFADASDALAVAIAPDELARLTARVEAWRASVADVSSRLAALDEVALPEERPDVEVLARARAQSRAAAEAAAGRLQVLDVRFSDASVALTSAERLEGASADAVAAYDTARVVFETLNGNNLTRVQLETWVLAGELDRVTAAANVHLARMTRHRYSLRRDEPSGVGARRSGLDLVVDDADTGRPRPPSTLSGGEQFQAALALALGLADVVSQTGDVHEALFVDEGFGSLDADALDEAVDALVGLHATGRMVGVITHVETMKRQLPVGIEVRKLPSGGSTLVR